MRSNMPQNNRNVTDSNSMIVLVEMVVVYKQL